MASAEGRARVRLSLALTAVLIGCGDRRADGGDWVVERDTIGDTIVVRTIAGSVWQGPARLVQEIRVGDLDGPDEYLLGRVGALAVDEPGTLYVFDSQAPALRKYALDGRYVATFGRQGGGPGEYRKPDDGSLAVLPDGRVLLRDPGNARINTYSPEGQPLDPWRIAGGRFVSRGLVVDSAGNVYTQVFGTENGMAIFSRAGEPGDTILAPKWDYKPPTVTAEVESARQTWGVPFSPAPRWAFSPLGHMLGGVSDQYRIDAFRSGEPVLRITRRVNPVPVTAEEKAAAEYRVLRAMRGLKPDWTWNGPAIPNEKPAFRDIFVGEDGRIWILVHTTGREAPELTSEPAPDGLTPPTPWREPIVFDVFEPDGTYLGEVHAPDGFQTSPPPVFGPQHVWAVVEDEMGVQYVVRYRVRH